MSTNNENHAAAATDFCLTMRYTDGDRFKVEQTVLLQNDVALSLEDAQEELNPIGRNDILAEQWGFPNLAPYRHEFDVPEHEMVDGCYVDISALEPAVAGRYYDDCCLLSDLIRNVERGGDAFFMKALREAREQQDSDNLQGRFEDAIALIRNDGHRLSIEQRALLIKESISVHLATQSPTDERRDIVIMGRDAPTCGQLDIQPMLERADVVLMGLDAPTRHQIQARIAVLGGMEMDTEALILSAREKCMAMDSFILDNKNERPRGMPALPFRRKVSKRERRRHR